MTFLNNTYQMLGGVSSHALNQSVGGGFLWPDGSFSSCSDSMVSLVSGFSNYSCAR